MPPFAHQTMLDMLGANDFYGQLTCLIRFDLVRYNHILVIFVHVLNIYVSAKLAKKIKSCLKIALVIVTLEERSGRS